MLRLFAALPVPDRAADRLEGLQIGLEGRVVPRENLHLTLAFFGELHETTAEDLDAALSRVTGPAPTVQLDGVDAFGGRKPHAIYAAARPDPGLMALQAKVAQAARSAGVEVRSGRYTPHVTLTRLTAGSVPPAEVAKLLQARAAFLAEPWIARRFELWRSDLGRNGPAYTPLTEYPLEAEGG